MKVATRNTFTTIAALIASAACSSSSAPPAPAACATSPTGVYSVDMALTGGNNMSGCQAAMGVAIRIAQDGTTQIAGAPTVATDTPGQPFAWTNCTARQVTMSECPEVVQVACDPPGDVATGFVYSADFDMFVDAQGSVATLPCTGNGCNGAAPEPSWADYGLKVRQGPGEAYCYWTLTGHRAQ